MPPSAMSSGLPRQFLSLSSKASAPFRPGFGLRAVGTTANVISNPERPHESYPDQQGSAEARGRNHLRRSDLYEVEQH